MAKHMSIAKQIKQMLRQANSQQSEAEQSRVRGLANPGGRLTYAHRMMRKAFTDASGTTGSRRCQCGRWISANKSACLACAKGYPNA